MSHTSIASYELHEVLHSGKKFTVYKAVHRVIPQQVVVAKVLHPADADLAASRQTLQEQAATLAQLTHPASVTFIDFINDGPTCALLTSLAPGRPISDLLEFSAAPLSLTRIDHIFQQLLDVLAYAHNRGIVHGRLCVDDLYLDTMDRLTVLGFASCGREPSRSSVRAELQTVAQLMTALITRRPMSDRVPTRQMLEDNGVSESLARIIAGLGAPSGMDAILSCGEALSAVHTPKTSTGPVKTLHLGTTKVHLQQHELHRNGQVVTLTGHDVALLSYFARHPNDVLSRERLLRDVWGNQGGMVTRAVDLAIGRLRKKIERDPAAPKHILTIHGRGYRFIPSDPSPLTQSTQVDIPPTPMDSTLFGRKADIQTVHTLCAQGVRLVTILGPSGMGKTTVAKAVLDVLKNENQARKVLFCDAQTATTLAGFVAIVAEVLDAPMSRAPDEEVAQLGRVLSALGPMLMVLDNLEQIAVDAGQAITQWLKVAPNLQCLVTSQIPMECPEEQMHVLDPLSRVDAEQLFRAAAHRAAPEVVLSSDDAVHIGPIVEALDCIPLAVELAAGRIRIFSPRQISQRLNHRFSLLASKKKSRPERHLTLRNAIDWSWQLLSPAEQHVLAQAAIFRGGFSVEAAESVVRPLDSEWVFDVLQRLAEKSLIQCKSVEGVRRFVFLQSIQQFILETTSAPDAVVRHREYFLGYVGSWSDACQRKEAKEAHRMLSLELDNMLQAARTEQGVHTIRFALLLDTHLEERGPRSLHEALLDAAIDTVAVGGLSEQMTVYAARARLRRDSKDNDAVKHVEIKAIRALSAQCDDPKLSARSVLIETELVTLPEGQVAVAATRLSEIETPIVTHGDAVDRYHLFQLLGRVAEHQARWSEAEDYCRRALTIAQSQANLRWEARSLQHLGLTLCNAGRTEDAELHLDNAIALYQHLGGRQGAANCMGILAELLLFRGQHERCDALLQQSIGLSHRLGNPVAAAAALGARGRVAMDQGEVDTGQRYLSESMEGLTNWPIASSVNQVHWAVGALLLGKPQAALEALRDSLDILSAQAYPKGRIYALYVAALASHRCGETQQAVLWLTEGHDLSGTSSAAHRAMVHCVAQEMDTQMMDATTISDEALQQSVARSYECRQIFRLCRPH